MPIYVRWHWLISGLAPYDRTRPTRSLTLMAPVDFGIAFLATAEIAGAISFLVTSDE